MTDTSAPTTVRSDPLSTGPNAGLDGTWPPHADDVAGLLNLLGDEHERVPSGTTSEVWRTRGRDGHDLVVRIAAPDVETETLRSHLATARALIAAGVAFASPRTDVIVGYQDLRATVWDDLGTGDGPQDADYEALGHTLRVLHEVHLSPAFDRTDVRSALAVLPDAEDRLAIRHAFEAAVTDRLLTLHEAAHLLPSLTTMDAFHDALDPAPQVVVHDDVWAKNVLFAPGSATLLDPDNVAWGRPESDLAFITRAHAYHHISDAQADAFASGYGADLPDERTAEILALPHRMRWMLHLASRRAWWTDRDRDMFEREVQRHAYGWI